MTEVVVDTLVDAEVDPRSNPAFSRLSLHLPVVDPEISNGSLRA